MIAIVRAATICTALALPIGAFAQDQAADAETDTDTQTESANQPATSGLSMGTVEGEAGEPKVGQTYVAQEISDWELRCVKTETGKDPCQLYQLLKDSQGNPVAEFSIFNLSDGGEAAAGATIVTPLETLLTAQLRMAVDASETRRYPYSFCSQIGCIARVGIPQGEVDAFKRGNAATITIVPVAAPNQNVGLKMSLAGFTAGWNALVEANTPEVE